ncbi:MAG: hypothetical protein ABEJ75_01840 [Candidatus Nanohaloarchaea archaeon]
MNSKTTTRLLVIAVLALGMVGSATAQTSEATDNSTVSVSIGSKIAIDISPTALDFGSITPGNEDSTATIGSGEVVGAIELENTGSENITHVWLNASTPTSKPFGTGTPSAYDSGNFMMVKTGNGDITGVTAYQNFTYVNRKEFNETSTLPYIFVPGEGSTAQNWSYGRFRVGDQEFFWAVNVTNRAAGTGQCVTGNNDFRLGVSAHNQTATGSNDFTDPAEYYSFSVTDVGTSGTNPYLVTGVELNGSVLSGHRNYDVVLNCGNPTWAMRTHFNIGPGTLDLSTSGSAAEFLVSSTNTYGEAALQPGEHFTVNVSMQVPLGVATGSPINGYLRVFANNN